MIQTYSWWHAKLMDNPGGLTFTYYATIKGFIPKNVTKTEILTLVSLIVGTNFKWYGPFFGDTLANIRWQRIVYWYNILSKWIIECNYTFLLEKSLTALSRRALWSGWSTFLLNLWIRVERVFPFRTIPGNTGLRFPFLKIGNDFFIPILVLNSWECNFSFPFPFKNLGIQFSIPVPVTRNGLLKSGIRTGMEFKRW